MSSVVEPRRWFTQWLPPTGPAVTTPATAWLARARAAATTAVQQLPLPDRKQEVWRYSGIDGLLQNSFTAVGEEFAALQAEDIDDWVLPEADAYRLVIANGRLVPSLQNFTTLPEGVVIGSLRDALVRSPECLALWFGKMTSTSQHIFTALNTALINDGLFVHLKPGIVLDRPIEVRYINLGLDEPSLIQPRNLIVLERGASAQLVERYQSTGDSVYFHNGVSEIVLEDYAALTHFRLQQESRQAYHLQQSFVTQAAHSHYRHTALAFGGKWARHDLQIHFQSEKAECQTRGVYLAGDGQLLDQHLDVLHNSPLTTSRHHFKGMLHGKGRGVFDGRILVGRDAQHTDAQLINNNLLLSRDAEIDTKPQLEIYADAVKCAHGATVGQLDPLQLFYLRSRGIASANATRLLCQGFAAEILDGIDNQQVRDYAERTLHAHLENVNIHLAGAEHD